MEGRWAGKPEMHHLSIAGRKCTLAFCVLVDDVACYGHVFMTHVLLHVNVTCLGDTNNEMVIVKL